MNPWKDRGAQAPGPEGTSTPWGGLRSEWERLMESFLRDPFGNIDWPFGARRGFVPVDVVDGGQELLVRAELPGLQAGDIDISLSGNQLVLSGERKPPADWEGKSRFRSECAYGPFRRTVDLPEVVDAERVSAEYANGVLTIRLQRTAPVGVKKVEIKSV